MSIPRHVAPYNEVMSDLENIRKEVQSGSPPFWCHKGHWPGPPRCKGVVTLHIERYGHSLFHDPHYAEAVYVTPKVANFLSKYVLAQQRSAAGNLNQELHSLGQARDLGEVPFRCHKGHWPGPPCFGAVTLHKDAYGYALFHASHDWEAVYVSESMAVFLTKYVLP